MTLKQLRKTRKLTQKECAEYLGIPLRTFQNYENDVNKSTSMKYLYMLQKLEKYGYIDENTGILTISNITDICSPIFKKFNVEYCYLFGSYAKGTATEKSDIDMLICTDTTGIQFFDLTETLREALKKKVDILNLSQLQNNDSLVREILKDGIKIYG